MCRLETTNLRLEGELERAPGWEEVHRYTHARTHTHTHTHTHTPCLFSITVTEGVCSQNPSLLSCQPYSRDATIKALELDLAAAPKQERMDQLVWVH